MQKFEEAKENREKMFMADNYANIKVDGVGNKGFWDINDGGLMSNKDRVTGIDEAAFNMFGTPQYSQEGGGVNNSGFKALPPHVQHNILSNMASGGEAAYLANRDRVIKREMAKAQEGIETDYSEPVESDGFSRSFFDMIKTVNNNIDETENTEPQPDRLGYNIEQILGGRKEYMNHEYYSNFSNLSQDQRDYMNSVYNGTTMPTKNEVKEYLNYLDMTGKEMKKLIKDSSKYQDATPLQKVGAKFVLNRYLKKGGETVNLSQDMIAELIAAGADIEIL